MVETLLLWHREKTNSNFSLFYGNKFCGESGASLQLKRYKTIIHRSLNIEIHIKLVIALNEKHTSNSLGYKK